MPKQKVTKTCKPISVSKETARRFMLQSLGLIKPFNSIAAALDALGYVQIDTINVCGKMQDLILRNRVNAYSEHGLANYLYPSKNIATSSRKAFEHYIPGSLVALPIDAYPYLSQLMRARATRDGAWSGRISPVHKKLAQMILRKIKKSGPISSLDIEHPLRTISGWGGDSKATKVVLEKLFFHGKILISRRDGVRRIYDLPERVLPKEILTAKKPSMPDVERWLIILRLKQRRLVRLSRAEAVLVKDLICEVEIDGKLKAYCLNDDRTLLLNCAEDRSDSDVHALIAPLDPLIYDRILTKRIWDFDYTWEVYTPAAKRVRGYYALPLLKGIELVGHVDPKIDRENSRLKLIAKSAPRGTNLNNTVGELATFLGVRY